MPRIYDNNFKFMMVDLIVNKKNSTSKTAEKYGVPLKTLEKCMEECIQIEEEIKTGRIGDQIGVETLICKLLLKS